MRRSQPHAGVWTPGVYPASSHTGITNYIKDRNAFDFISAHQRPNDVSQPNSLVKQNFDVAGS